MVNIVKCAVRMSSRFKDPNYVIRGKTVYILCLKTANRSFEVVALQILLYRLRYINSLKVPWNVKFGRLLHVYISVLLLETFSKEAQIMHIACLLLFVLASPQLASKRHTHPPTHPPTQEANLQFLTFKLIYFLTFQSWITLITFLERLCFSVITDDRGCLPVNQLTRDDTVASLVESMNTVCRFNPVLIGKFYFFSIYICHQHVLIVGTGCSFCFSAFRSCDDLSTWLWVCKCSIIVIAGKLVFYYCNCRWAGVSDVCCQWSRWCDGIPQSNTRWRRHYSSPVSP